MFSISLAEAMHALHDSPATWGLFSIVVWLSYIAARGWRMLQLSDRQQFVWGILSAVAFLNFLQYDPEFRGWGDVYFFCGRSLQYCTCHFRWNVLGWLKATVIWNFVLTAALGSQRFLLQIGLNGLLPGALQALRWIACRFRAAQQPNQPCTLQGRRWCARNRSSASCGASSHTG